MTKAEAQLILQTAFAALNARQRGNLRYHAEKGTAIACGDEAGAYARDGYG